MAASNPPLKNTAFNFDIILNDAAVPGSFKVTPTIAAGDFQVAKDGGSYANLATLPVVTPAGSDTVFITLSSTEMNADRVTVRGKDQTTPKEWTDTAICILTV